MSESWLCEAPKGGGKSRWAVYEMCHTLESHPTQMIATSIPIMLHLSRSPEETAELAVEIARYMERKKNEYGKLDSELYWTISEYCQYYVKHKVNVAGRVLYLDPEQARTFFLRVPLGDRPPLTDEQLSANRITPYRFECPDDGERTCAGYLLPTRPSPLFKWLGDYSSRGAGGSLAGGIDYYIDEAHKLFPSRMWQSKEVAGMQLEDYMSESRKLNDNLYLISQNSEKVDLNSRRNLTGWLYVQNMSRIRLLLGVSFRNKFRVTYYQQTDKPQKSDKPSKTVWFDLKYRRQQWLYRTMYGASVKGGGHAEQVRFKGLHWSVWIVAAVILFYVCRYSPMIIESVVQRGVSSVMGGATKGAQAGMAAKKNETQPKQLEIDNRPEFMRNLPQVGGAAASGSGFQPPAREMIPASPPASSSLTCKGFISFPDGRCWVTLSDGSIYKSERNEVEGIGDNWVKVNGQRYRIK